MTQAPPPPPAGMGPAPVDYPVVPVVESPPEIKRWLPLVAWFLAIPHYIVLFFLGIAAFVAVIVAFFAILFTKRMPEGIFRFLVMTHRYSWRVMIYTTFLVNEYPPFDFDTSSPNDQTPYAARYSVQGPEAYNRWLPLVKWLLAIPHWIVLYFLGIAAWIVTIIGFFAVLFTKRWPEGLRDFVIGVYRWQYRVNGYVGLLVDPYPPFSIDR